MIVYCLIHTISVPDIVLQLWRKLRVKNREGFFTIPYHHDVTGSFGSSDVLLDGKSPRI